jgi:Angiotensin II, type I receptor-associated protein (AGTRAP)
MAFELRIPHIPLKVMFLVHLVLFSWCLLGVHSGTFGVTNSAVILLLYVAAATQSPLACETNLVALFFSIINDIIVLGLHGQGYIDSHSSSVQFGFAMAILNIIVKPLTMIFVFQEFRRRGGEFGIAIESGASQQYESLPDPGHRNPQSSHAHDPAVITVNVDN